jgi:hypothetical protein
MSSLATKLTRVTLDAERTISTGSFRVLGIIVSNATASDAEVVFRDNDANNLLNITAPAHDSVEFSANWVANNGLVIPSAGDVNVVVTVAHGADGA